MWTHLFLEQLHFSIQLFAALVLFAVGWLYFDAWQVKKIPKQSFRFIGFFILSFSYLIRSVILESMIVSTPLFGGSLIHTYTFLHTLGYILIFVSLILDPIQNRPDIKSPFIPHPAIQALSGAVLVLEWIMPPVYWLGALLIGLLYYRQASKGMERHLDPVATSFFILSASELLSIAPAVSQTAHVGLYQLTMPFGPVWILTLLLLLSAMLLLRKWVFSYLLKQFTTQLFMIFTTTIVFIFIITSITFSSFLLTNIQNESLMQLKTNVKILDYALDSKRSALLSDTQIIAQNPQIQGSLSDTSNKTLRDLAQQYLVSKKQSSLVIVTKTGKVIARGENPDRIGDSLSDDQFFKNALSGKETCGLVNRDGVLAPELVLRCAVPVIREKETVGAIALSTLIDNAFVDGIKHKTGLEATLYANDTISATTLVASDGVTRPLGTKETSKRITFPVLSAGVEYAGPVTFLSQPYLGAYTPLKNTFGGAMGMLFVGKPQSFILAAAGRSFELTFIMTTVLLILSIIPAYFISRYISKQL